MSVGTALPAIGKIFANRTDRPSRALITCVIAAFGIVLLSGSFSIAFDGVFALADAAMTTVALDVSA